MSELRYLYRIHLQTHGISERDMKVITQQFSDPEIAIPPNWQIYLEEALKLGLL